MRRRKKYTNNAIKEARTDAFYTYNQWKRRMKDGGIGMQAME